MNSFPRRSSLRSRLSSALIAGLATFFILRGQVNRAIDRGLTRFGLTCCMVGEACADLATSRSAKRQARGWR